MNIEEKKQLVYRQYEEVMNKKNLDMIDADFADNFVDHEAAPGAQPGREGLKHWLRHLHDVVSDFEVMIEDILIDGDKVAVRNLWRGTHTGPFLGMPPTGKRFEVKGIVIWRIENGKLQERWATFDLWALHKQLGMG